MIVPVAALIDEPSIGAQVFVQVRSGSRSPVEIGGKLDGRRVSLKRILSAGGRRKSEKENPDDSVHAIRSGR
jgi:hypothetical protein